MRMRIALGLLIVLAGWCGRGWYLQRVSVSEPPGPGMRAEELADGLNPNAASWASLARLGGIGRVRAMGIVEYRQQWRQRHGPDEQAFRCAEDLMAVKGIGPATVERIKGRLIFDNP